MVLDIPCAPPGLNVLMRMHWARRSAAAKKWRKLVWVARCQAVIGKPVCLSHARVTITRTSPRLLDEDNLYGSAKLLLDALVRNELIQDDSPQHLELIVSQRVGRASVRIEIDDISTSPLCSSQHHSTTTSSVVGS